MKKWCVVIPTCRPQKFHEFLEAWKDMFNKHRVELHVVCDAHDSSPFTDAFAEIEHLDITTCFHDWMGIDEDLGGMSWIIPQRSDCIRSYGFYKAWQSGCDYILTLDDDVRPVEGRDIFKEYEGVFEKGMQVSEYYNVGELFYNHDAFMRGFPYKDRGLKKVMLQYGMWDGVPDLDGSTQLRTPIDNAICAPTIRAIPKGTPVTGCIMNCAFRREFVPYFYQLLMGGSWGFDRWGDIWSGLVAKRVCDGNNWAVVLNGMALVRHDRASDPLVNVKKESTGIKPNEKLWYELTQFPATHYKAMFVWLRYRNVFDNKEYSDALYEAVQTWSLLFEEIP